MIGAVAIFALGSGLSGGASSAIMLLAGRVIQGIGGAGLTLMTGMIVSDIVPVRERGKYMSIIFCSFSVGTGLGPFVGGALVERASWRWVFYINLPICGAALIMLYLFLQVHRPKTWTAKEKLLRIDFIGNALLVASCCSILIALSWGGARYAWSTYHVLVPLLLGFAGTVFFHWYESTSFCKEPTIPSRMLTTSRTTTIVMVLSFCQFMLSFWSVYFFPVYFQGVLLVSPERSGVLLLATAVTSPPLAIIAGNLLSRTGRYKPLHVAAMGLFTLGLGLCIKLDSKSGLGEYIVFQLIIAVGNGLLMSTLLPAAQADLPEKDVAVATATWGFLRSYGGIWGVAIPGAIFNSQFQHFLHKRVTDPTILAELGQGSAYASVSGTYVRGLSDTIRQEVISVYGDALQVVWIVATAFAGATLCLVLFEKEIPLRTTVKSDYGLKEKKKSETAREEEGAEDNGGNGGNGR